MANVPASIQLPSAAPQDWGSLAGFLSQLGITLNAWIGTVAARLNGGNVAITAASAPGKVTGQFTIYVDSADSKLKAIGPSGTVTTLALP
jgi:hypothetical protein